MGKGHSVYLFAFIESLLMYFYYMGTLIANGLVFGGKVKGGCKNTCIWIGVSCFGEVRTR
jgi:hypothetical protein